MGLFWTLYGALTAGFLAGAAVYLWRWKQPPEVITKEKTSIVQAPPEIRYMKDGPDIVRCCECINYGFEEVDGIAKLRCRWHKRDTMPDAFCSAGERPAPYVAPKNYSDYADAYRNYCRIAEYNEVKNQEV